MFNNNILVLGSKPGSNLPDINVDKTYRNYRASSMDLHDQKNFNFIYN